MILNINTDSMTVEDLSEVIGKLQEIMDKKKRSPLFRRKVMTAGERIARMKKIDSVKNPNTVRIYDEFDEKSCTVPFVQHNEYKLVKACDLRKTISSKGVSRWVGGLKEGEQAVLWPFVHSVDGDVLVCGENAFIDGGEEDYNHPRFVL